MAPSGFPSHKQLEATLLKLEASHKGLLKVNAGCCAKAASLGADQWRVMCKHVYELAKKPDQLNEVLKGLTDMIVMSAAGSSSTVASSSKKAKETKGDKGGKGDRGDKG